MKRRHLLVALLAGPALWAGLVLGAPAALAASTAPAVPSGLTATPNSTTVSLSWAAPADGGSAILGYDVYEATTSGAENYSIPANGSILVVGTTAVVRGLTNGTTYYFTVTAVNAVGASTASNEAWSVPGGPAPGAPTGVTASPGDASATVNWNQPLNQGGSTITAYKVTAADSTQSNRGGQTCTWATGPLSCVLSGLTNGDSYTFTVTATNSVGTGAASLPSNAVVPTAAAGRKSPTRLTLTMSQSRILFGREEVEHFSVTVRSPNNGPDPTGRVFIMAQSCRTGSPNIIGYCPAWSLAPRMDFACTITLTAGSGGCTLPSRGLYVGTYRLWAFYTGSASYKSSSTSRILVVLRRSVRS